MRQARAQRIVENKLVNCSICTTSMPEAAKRRRNGPMPGNLTLIFSGFAEYPIPSIESAGTAIGF